MADLLPVDADVPVDTDEWDVEGNFLGTIITPPVEPPIGPDDGGHTVPTKDNSWWFLLTLGGENPRFEVTSTWTQKRLFGYFPAEQQAVNLHKLTDGTYTLAQPDDYEIIDTWYQGGHIFFITEEEAQNLTDAGYGAYVHPPAHAAFTLDSAEVALNTPDWDLAGNFVG